MVKTLTTNDLLDVLERLDHRDVPIIIVGEQQRAVGVQIVYQEQFDERFPVEVTSKPVALMIQLVPSG